MDSTRSSRGSCDSREDWVALSLVPGLGVTTFWRLLEHFSSPQAVLNVQAQQLAQLPAKYQRAKEALLKGGWQKRAAAEIMRLEKYGGRVLVWGDREYPQALTQLADPPPVLYGLGDFSLLQKPLLAVVGSRAASSYGLRMASAIGRELAQAGVVVVSGLAAGIDAAAHKGALAAGKTAGKTVAVLGCGLDHIYPRQNSGLYKNIAAKGLLLSEYPLGTKPEAFRFPARNRIIAGMASGVVVVEATRKSGSLITAQIALDYGRDVFAVPGQMDSVKSEGCHLLIRSGATLVTGVADILADSQITPATMQQKSSKEWQELPASGESESERVLRLLDVYPVAKDELVERSGLDVKRINELCLLLELEGLIENLPGERVCRVKH